MKYPLLVLLTSLLTLNGCKKKQDPPAPEPTPSTGSVSMEFDNRFGNDPLSFGSWYKNAHGDSLQLTKFKYYISNVSWKKDDGSVYSVPESYQIIVHPTARTISFADIPAGSYTGVNFMLGVDSARNVSGAQTGGLDVGYASDMFWSWSSGYIFLKIEAKSPQSGAPGKTVTYHIGGYGGENKAQRSYHITFPAALSVDASHTAKITIKADAAEIFKSPSTIDVKTVYSQASPGPGSKLIADNYADMFSFGGMQN